ncbi:hypothetical protein Tco_0560529 [Tanacetum coccineum]
MDVGRCYLDENKDVVEFFPYDSFHHVLAASTCTPQEGDRSNRSQSISLFNVDMGRVDLFYRLKMVVSVRGNVTHPLLPQADAGG